MDGNSVMETLAEDLSGGLQLEEWPRGREEEEDIEWSDSSGTEEDITTSAMDPWSLSLCNSCAPLAEGEEPPSTVEQVIYRCNPTQQEALRKEVLNVQYAVGFDAESIVRQYLRVGDSSQKTLHQCMVPVKPCSAEWLPSNMSEWMCSVCPEGTRRLVVASHKSTRVHSWSGKFLEEHESHLPGGSRSSISAVNEENDCTILDCMYLKEIQMYYVLDMLYWKGRSFYQVEARDRITTLHEKMNGIPTLGKIMQTNTRRFRLVPLSYTSDKESVCAAIASTQFAISGLMLCHKRSLYMRGVTPVALWVPVYLVQGVMEILISKRNINKLCGREWRRKEYTVRPKRVFDVQNAACIASCQTSWRHPSQYDAHPPWSFYGSYYVRHENCNNHKLTCPHIYYENYTLQPQERYNHHHQQQQQQHYSVWNMGHDWLRLEGARWRTVQTQTGEEEDRGVQGLSESSEESIPEKMEQQQGDEEGGYYDEEGQYFTEWQYYDEGQYDYTEEGDYYYSEEGEYYEEDEFYEEEGVEYYAGEGEYYAEEGVHKEAGEEYSTENMEEASVQLEGKELKTAETQTVEGWEELADQATLTETESSLEKMQPPSGSMEVAETQDLGPELPQSADDASRSESESGLHRSEPASGMEVAET